MEEEIKRLRLEIEEIKKRNARVESDKAWETSTIRIVAISILTYIVAAIVLYFIGAPRSWLSALVPTAGFYLSTQTMVKLKMIWLAKKQR